MLELTAAVKVRAREPQTHSVASAPTAKHTKPPTTTGRRLVDDRECSEYLGSVPSEDGGQLRRMLSDIIDLDRLID